MLLGFRWHITMTGSLPPTKGNKRQTQLYITAIPMKLIRESPSFSQSQSDYHKNLPNARLERRSQVLPLALAEAKHEKQSVLLCRLNQSWLLNILTEPMLSTIKGNPAVEILKHITPAFNVRLEHNIPTLMIFSL